MNKLKFSIGKHDIGPYIRMVPRDCSSIIPEEVLMKGHIVYEEFVNVLF